MLSVVRQFPGLALCAAALVAAMCVYSQRYGCGLAWCCRVLMHPCVALCAAAVDLALNHFVKFRYSVLVLLAKLDDKGGRNERK